MKQYPNLKWILFKNYLFDLRDFNSHPGGDQIIKRVIGKFFYFSLIHFEIKYIFCKGREISRFLFGVTGLETLNNYPVVHS